MAGPQWTDEQRAAIELRGQILVAAAAGSGKTAVLVERLIRRIMDPQQGEDVDRFLVVTFTKAAANEMRERIGKALDEALFKETDPALTERLLQQRTLLARASITTLHSFCMDLLRQYFFLIDLDPAFRVADDAEADLIRQDAMLALFEARYDGEDEGFLSLVEAFGSDRNDQPLMEIVLELHEFAMSQRDSEEWLRGLPLAYRWDDPEDLVASPWGQVVAQGVRDILVEAKALLADAYRQAVVPDGPRHYADVLQEDENRLEKLAQALEKGSWGDVEARYREAIAFPNLPRGSSKRKKASNKSVSDKSATDKSVSDKSVSDKSISEGISEVVSEGVVSGSEEDRQKALQEASKKARDEGKAKLKELQELFGIPLADQLPLLRALSEHIDSLATLVSDFAVAYGQAKGQRNVVDYADLEHFALKILTHQENDVAVIANKLREYYAEVLVDEYQDINPVQERLLEMVSRSEGDTANRFMVGDVKQSIYRFRMADPGLFIKKYGTLERWYPGEAARGNQVVVDLNRNFRSREEVLSGVNFLFRQIMTVGAGEIAYDDQAALQPGASFLSSPEVKTGEGPIELHLFDPKRINDQGGKGDKRDTPAVSVLDPEDAPGGNASAIGDIPLGGDTSADDGESSAEEEDGLGELETVRIEARLAAARIQHMVLEKEFQIYDKALQGFRSVQYSDIVVLMRSFASAGPLYLEEFQKAGIPVYGETGKGYFALSEVETVIALLKIIDNPHQDIPLAAVLRSPLVGLDGGQLGKVRAMLPQGDFYEALVLAFWASLLIAQGEVASSASSQEQSEQESFGPVDPAAGELAPEEIANLLYPYKEKLPGLLEKAKTTLLQNEDLRNLVRAFLPQLQRWRHLAQRNSLADLIWILYQETGFLSYVGTLPSGVQRQANLQLLLDRATRFEATNFRGLFRFLRFLEKFQGQGKDLGMARPLTETENVVSLMTVHASKGLEYPVVLLCGLGKGFNKQNLREPLLKHARLGIGVPLLDIQERVSYPSFIRFALKQQLWQEALAEELRILYVALTRAKERLILFGGGRNLSNHLEKWQRLAMSCTGTAFSDGKLRGAGTFLDWLGPALARHPDNLFASPAETAESTTEPWQYPSTSQWKVFLHEKLGNPERDPGANSEQEASLREGEEVEEESWTSDYDRVDRCLSWSYPYPEAVSLMAKMNISELKRQFPWHTAETLPAATVPGTFPEGRPDFSFDRPQFIRTVKEPTASERGIAFHSVMQHLPLERWQVIWQELSPEKRYGEVEKFLESLVQREILSPELLKTLGPQVVLELLDSSLGQRLLICEDIRREVPFTLALVPPGKNEPVLIQGIIDALLVSADRQRVEIIDFKTDRLRSDPDPERTLAERYGFQLAVYARAVKDLLQVPHITCTLYSVALKRDISLPKDIYASLFVDSP